MSERWPFCFDPDDVEVESYGDMERDEGVSLKHLPTGATVYMTAYSMRDDNIQAGFRRLDRIIRGLSAKS